MTLLAFFLIRLVPGDPIETLAGERGIDPVRHEALRHEYGLDRPVLVQYGIYIGRVLHGDLGKSMITQAPVLSRIHRAISGDDRTGAVRDPVRAGARHPRRNHRGGKAQLDLRSWRDGGVAHRLFDADLLVGIAADPAVLRAARLDARVGAHLGPVLPRAGHRLSDDRRAAVRRKGRVQVGRFAPHSADHRARYAAACHHRADDAFGDARGARARTTSARRGPRGCRRCASSPCTRCAMR